MNILWNFVHRFVTLAAIRIAGKPTKTRLVWVFGVRFDFLVTGVGHLGYVALWGKNDMLSCLICWWRWSTIENHLINFIASDGHHLSLKSFHLKKFFPENVSSLKIFVFWKYFLSRIFQVKSCLFLHRIFPGKRLNSFLPILFTNSGGRSIGLFLVQ